MRTRIRTLLATVTVTLSAAASAQPAQTQEVRTPEAWSFAVSGDSRNCGDVVMPAIARGVSSDGARFYVHLGDFRAISNFDQDVLAQPTYRNGKQPTIFEYESRAWDDFIAHQIDPFGATPVYLAMGNHETVSPKTREQWLIQFADWLDSPTLRAQRLADNPHNHLLTAYYHWIEGGVDFIVLDNATPDQFSKEQMVWLKGVLARDAADATVRSIVAGMHEALPHSISESHAMDEFAQGVKSGEEVYGLLLHARDDSHKNVYVIASHSHYYLDGAFDTQVLRAKGKPLPGWVVGTAGAVRYPLPPDLGPEHHAQTHVYGYLLGTVQTDGHIDFTFKTLGEAELKAANTDYTPEFISDCVENNPRATSAAH